MIGFAPVKQQAFEAIGEDLDPTLAHEGRIIVWAWPRPSNPLSATSTGR